MRNDKLYNIDGRRMDACTRGIRLKLHVKLHSEKDLSQGCSAHQIPHGVLRLNPGVLGEQPTTDRLSYG